MLQTLLSWQVCHIKPKADYAAHRVVKAVIKLFMNKVWINNIPEGIDDIVTFGDMSGFN